MLCFLQRRRGLCAAAIALCTLWAGVCYRPFGGENTIFAGTATLLALTGGFAAGFAAIPRMTRRSLAFALPVSALLGLCCGLGAQLQAHDSLAFTSSQALACAGTWVGLTALGTCLGSLVLTEGGKALERAEQTRLLQRLERSRALSAPRVLLTAWLMIFLCWVPVWMAFFPGLANYDVESHLMQCQANAYTTLHPLLYTLLIKACMLAGNGTAMVAVLAGLQMLLLSFAAAHALGTARRLGAQAWLCLAGLLFCALLPTFPLLAISTTKDIPYTAFAVLTFSYLLRLTHEKAAFFRRPTNVVGLLLCALLMGLLRYNGVVSLALLGVALAIFLRGCRVRACALIAGILALTLAGTQALNAAFDVKKSFVPERDMASLPSQQLVRAALETADETEKERVLSYYDERALQRYVPQLADYTKMYLDVSQGRGWRDYLLFWAQTVLRHPRAYIEAFLQLCRGLWFPDDQSYANIYPADIPLFGYLTNNQNTYDWYPIETYDWLPRLKAWYNRVTTENTFLKVPLLSGFFSTAWHWWAALLLFLLACYRRDRSGALAALWPLSAVVVLAAAPAVLARYLLPVFLINPSLLAYVLRPRDQILSR
ncbi:MAG: hypothetical protein EOM69_03390 [Clostridia bacterium]|nr:hypothetical protein [Clostridia bacterium]